MAVAALGAVTVVLLPADARATTAHRLAVEITFHDASPCTFCTHHYEGSAVSVDGPVILRWTFSLTTERVSANTFEGTFTLQNTAGHSLSGGYFASYPDALGNLPAPDQRAYSVTGGTGAYTGCTSPFTSVVAELPSPVGDNTVDVLDLVLTCP